MAFAPSLLPSQVAPFVSTLVAVTSSHTLVLLAHQTRALATEELLFSTLGHYFDLQLIPREALDPAFASDKIGVWRALKKLPVW